MMPRPHPAQPRRGRIAAGVALAVAGMVVGRAEAAVSGLCRFDSEKLLFEGTPEQSARCLLRPVLQAADLGPALERLPPTLAGLVGQPVQVSRDGLRRYLGQVGLRENDIGGSLDEPLSKNGEGVAARYFVIHDTSAPYLGDAPSFPADIDRSAAVNALSGYAGANSVAHLFVNRRGEVLTGHDFATGWRATKLESGFVGVRARGLFIHVELIQPRRRNPAGKAGNDQFAPEPGFTDAQYDRLALAYVVAGVRGGRWLVPGFHAVIDSGISDAHDDPQHFDLTKFDDALRRVIEKASASP